MHFAMQILRLIGCLLVCNLGVRGWASYYRLSDHCIKPLAEGEDIMGAAVMQSTERELVVSRKSGERVQCGATVEAGDQLLLNITDPPGRWICNLLLQFSAYT